MLLVVATLAVSPTDAEEARAALDALVEASRGDAGCRSYEFLESIEQPGRFRSIEEWDDKDTMDAHMRTSHVAAAVTALTPKLTSELEIVTHEVGDGRS